MKTRAWLCSLAAVGAASCLQTFELPEVTDTAGMGGGGTMEAVPCGALGEACCAEPMVACGAQLRCDETSQTCVTEEARLCVTEEQCHRGQTWCPSGLLGSCVTLQTVSNSSAFSAPMPGATKGPRKPGPGHPRPLHPDQRSSPAASTGLEG